MAIIESSEIAAEATARSHDRRYVVWIDTNLGDVPPDWEMNSSPKSQALAKLEAIGVRVLGWLALVLPEGQTPRSDGFFGNPATGY